MRKFLMLCKKRKNFTKAPPSKLISNLALCKKQKLFVKALHVMFLFNGGRFKEEILFTCEYFLCNERNENNSQGPPLTLVLLYCKFLIENHAVQLACGIFKEEILFRCEHFLCYARNKNISLRPPLNISVTIL